MTFPVAPQRAPASTPLALALCLIASTPALAQSADQTFPPVFVTGARFASDPSLLPIGATVITADEIRRAGATDVNLAIRKIGGVYGRQSLDSSSDFSLDLRGFGADSEQNLVILLDGVRLSENELSSAVLSSIPIDTVERIEITRGGASVLYGDGATGGVIQIVTKRARRNASGGTIGADVGQFKDREGRASAFRSWDGFALDGAVSRQDSDNYRANNAFKQTNGSIGAQWTFTGGRAGVRVDSARQDARFPGALTMAEFLADPRQSTHPHDFGKTDFDRQVAFAEQLIGSVDVAAELAHREKTVMSSLVFGAPPASVASYVGKQTQFSPRLRQSTQFDGLLNEVVAGVDLVRWTRKTDASFSQANVEQTSKAVYLRDEIKWDAAHDVRLAVGARHETFKKSSVNPAPFATDNYQDQNQGLNAWEIQGSYRIAPPVNLYAKAGQSYRVANADENGYTAIVGGVLKPQSSHDLELGASVGSSAQMLTARMFRHQVSNEIFFDPTVNFGFGYNTNLDPTRRQGFEVDGNASIARDWNVSGHLQHVDAKFTAGPNAGRAMILVPKNVLSARLSWVPADGQSADIGAQWVDSQRYGSDFDNSCGAMIPSYTTLDARYARKFGPWEFALSGLNLADKRYFSYAFGCKSGIYPSDARQLKISARYDF